MAISKIVYKSSPSATPVTWMDVTQKTVTSGTMLNGTTALKNDGTDITGGIQSQAAQTIHPSASDQTIASGKYLSGTQTVKGVLLTNLSAGNIKKDVVIKVGDSTDDDCVTSVTGTYEGGGGGSDSILQQIKSLGTDGLRYAELPESVFFGSLLTTGTYALAAITGCKTMVLPVITSLGQYCFADNKSIETFDFGDAITNTFSSWIFSGSNKLSTLICREQSVMGLGGNALNETPFASNGAATGGTLYVPSSLISSYLSATNWSTILGYAKNSIVAIEGSYYETHYADGTLIS